MESQQKLQATGVHNDNTRRLNFDAMESIENSKHVGHRGRRQFMERDSEHLIILPHNHKVDQCVIGQVIKDGTLVEGLPESVVRYGEMHSKDLNKKSTDGDANNKRKVSVSLKDDVETVLQTAASAVAQGFVSTLVSHPG